MIYPIPTLQVDTDRQKLNKLKSDVRLGVVSHFLSLWSLQDHLNDNVCSNRLIRPGQRKYTSSKRESFSKYNFKI